MVMTMELQRIRQGFNLQLCKEAKATMGEEFVLRLVLVHIKLLLNPGNYNTSKTHEPSKFMDVNKAEVALVFNFANVDSVVWGRDADGVVYAESGLTDFDEFRRVLMQYSLHNDFYADYTIGKRTARKLTNITIWWKWGLGT